MAPRQEKILRIALVGCRGRMGQRVTRLLQAHPERGTLGLLLGRREVATPARALADALGDVDVVLDFSAPAACQQVAPACALAQVPLLVASTALTDVDLKALDAAQKKTAVLLAANLSLGVHVLAHVLTQAAQMLPKSDVELFEVHHRHKRDAPSGTALFLAEAAQKSRPNLHAASGRRGQHVRAFDDLGIQAIRGGDAAGEHTAMLMLDGERLELTHRCYSADVFADGAVTACHFLARQQAGRFRMADVVKWQAQRATA